MLCLMYRYYKQVRIYQGSVIAGQPYVDALVREAWWNGGRLLFCFAKEDRELLHGRHRNVAAVVPC